MNDLTIGVLEVGWASVQSSGQLELFSESGSSTTDDFRYREEMLIGMLQIGSQLARESETHFPSLEVAFTPKKLVDILLSDHGTQLASSGSYSFANARARCCNLIGNLCRYVQLSYSNEQDCKLIVACEYLSAAHVVFQVIPDDSIVL